MAFIWMQILRLNLHYICIKSSTIEVHNVKQSEEPIFVRYFLIRVRVLVVQEQRQHSHLFFFFSTADKLCYYQSLIRVWLLLVLSVLTLWTI